MKKIKLMNDNCKIEDLSGSISTMNESTHINYVSLKCHQTDSLGENIYVDSVIQTIGGCQEIWSDDGEMYSLDYTHEEMCKILNEQNFCIDGNVLRFGVSYVQDDGTTTDVMFL